MKEMKAADVRLEEIYSFIGNNFSGQDRQNVENKVAERYQVGAHLIFVSDSLSMGNRFFKRDAETRRRKAVRALGLCSALNLHTSWDQVDAIIAAKRDYTEQNALNELSGILKTFAPVAKTEIQQIIPTKVTRDPRLAPSFNKANSMERRFAIEAVEKASVLLSRAWPAISGAARNGTLQARFTLYFGAWDAGRFATVKRNLKTIHDVACSEELQLYYRTSKVVGDPDDTPGAGGALIQQAVGAGTVDTTFAYVLRPSPGPGSHLFLCKLFFDNTHLDRGTDSIGGVFIHELSHALCNTNDHIYGEGNSQVLASNNPVQAIDNADNYEYYCESFLT
jgi:hypothetical protein